MATTQIASFNHGSHHIRLCGGDDTNPAAAYYVFADEVRFSMDSYDGASAFFSRVVRAALAHPLSSMEEAFLNEITVPQSRSTY